MRLNLLVLSIFACIPSVAQNLIAVDLTTDQYASETLWQIDGINVSFFANGSGGLDHDTPGSYPLPTEFVDLPNGNFHLCLGDAFDDGFCCAFGQGSLTVTHVASGIVLFHTDTFSTSIVCIDFGVPLGRVQGTLFLDDDHNCDPGAAESRIPGQILRVLPGPIYGLTEANGDYDIRVPYGDFTIDVVSTGLVPICPATEPVPFNTSAALPVAQVLLGDSSVAKLDIVAAAGIGPARPGFSVTHTIQFTNASTFMSGPITATAQLDPLIVYTGATIAPSSVVGNSITWSLPPLSGFTQHTIQVQGQLPPDPLLIGQELALAASAYQTLDEQVLWNNACDAHVIITGSFDPNDKQVWPNDLYDLAVDSILDYTIRFQNTGTDTAFTVVITDTLATELDMGTFQAGASSHPCTIAFKPDRVVEWRFADILLPDSNVNEPASHGLVSFRIKPVAPVLAGTIFENTANIYFDFNPPVITEPSVLVAEFSTGIQERSVSRILLSPNPTSGLLNVLLPASADRAFSIITADGRTVSAPSKPTDQGVQIDTGSLPPGLYLLRSSSGTARFVKQ